ncbi:aminoglycoside phosphotransferase family protein [Microbacterium sp.]|uniref:aminoglycoside phosphotransferase family protein n=1 Tax=Microbacterium sp. TaxID=51671 RepID=UPI003A8F3515
MARTPEAELDVDLVLVTRLLRDQHADLADLPMTIAASGWDNVMARVGDDLAVRAPRRAIAAALIEHEQLVLPRIAPRLPVAVPVPVRSGHATAFYPWPWSVVPWFEGVSAASASPAQRDAWAEDLADVMIALHMPADTDAPANPVRGVPLAQRSEASRVWLARGTIERGDELRAVIDRGLRAAPHRGAPVWIHGDPHPLNLVVRDDRLAAVVDFGDVTAGDPASDLATAWMTFTPTGREDFIARYTHATGVDAATWRRAHAWAAHLAIMMLAHSDDAPELAVIGRHTADQVLGEG